jgi:hypothetical protein
MFRPALVAVLLVAAPALADPTADLERAKAAHAKELGRLRDQLLAAFDAEIKAQRDAGGPPLNYLLAERRAFADNGVTPILPQMRKAAEKYLDGKRAAEEQLATALDAAGHREEAKRLRDGPEPPAKRKTAAAPAVETKADLARHLANSSWPWAPQEDLRLAADGSASTPKWKEPVRWEVIDRRTVVLYVVGGRDRDRLAVLRFSEDLGSFTGFGFDGRPFHDPRRRKP